MDKVNPQEATSVVKCDFNFVPYLSRLCIIVRSCGVLGRGLVSSSFVYQGYRVFAGNPAGFEKTRGIAKKPRDSSREIPRDGTKARVFPAGFPNAFRIGSREPGLPRGRVLAIPGCPVEGSHSITHGICRIGASFGGGMSGKKRGTWCQACGESRGMGPKRRGFYPRDFGMCVG